MGERRAARRGGRGRASGGSGVLAACLRAGILPAALLAALGMLLACGLSCRAPEPAYAAPASIHGACSVECARNGRIHGPDIENGAVPPAPADPLPPAGEGDPSPQSPHRSPSPEPID